ncbi:MAG TPA: heavy metal translocating P-type ATPase, partial [Clostridiales bacterium]|nr:heavy metal translocating P-type ATPase [Clostridiales bacterium]
GILGEDEASASVKSRADELASEGRTPLLFARNGRVAGIIAVADTVKTSSREAIRRFREMGLHIIMLTGDNRLTAEAIRKELGIEEAVADVLPTEKEAKIRDLRDRGRKV